LKDLSLFGCTILDEGVFENLVKRIEAKEIMPIIARTFPLHRVAEAQQVFKTKQHVGKLVIDFSIQGYCVKGAGPGPY
jgi:NADPH:quinone reductase-like Zn-dependent oxidoreductase